MRPGPAILCFGRAFFFVPFLRLKGKSQSGKCRLYGKFLTKVLYLGKIQCYHPSPFKKTVSGGGFHPESEAAENAGNFHAHLIS